MPRGVRRRGTENYARATGDHLRPGAERGVGKPAGRGGGGSSVYPSPHGGGRWGTTFCYGAISRANLVRTLISPPKLGTHRVQFMTATALTSQSCDRREQSLMANLFSGCRLMESMTIQISSRRLCRSC